MDKSENYTGLNKNIKRQNMEMEKKDYVFFTPGDLVQVRHDLEVRPKLWVVEKVARSLVNKDGEKESLFVGIKCRWFSTDGKLQEAVFSTKDLMHVE